MNRLTLFLAIVTILAPFTAAQFSANFTRVLAGYGPRSVILTPANITEADGTQYWDIERGSIDAPEGEWTLDLLNIDGSVVSLENQNNDLVVVEPNGNTTSVSSRIPPLLGITGPELIQVISNNVQLGVESAYADPSSTRVTNAQANTAGRAVVDQISAASSLPPFFLAPFRAQAYQQINQSLANAQAVSAAYNRSLGGDNGEGENPTPVGNTVALNYNFSSLNINDLDNVREIIAIAGNHTVDVVINGEVEGIEGDAFGSYLSSLNVIPNLEEGEWQLTWVDDNGENHVVLNQNGDIVVVNPDGSLDDVTETAGYWANAETSDVDLAVGNAIQDFVDAVLENQVLNTNETVTINVGPQGLNWTYPASVEGAL